MEAIMNTYSRFPLTLVKGQGCKVVDVDGKEYLDFVAGIAVNALGHGHEKLCAAIADQAKNLIHVSNLYWNQPQMDLAEKLVSHTCFDKVFFCNSGAEAIEGSLKLSRKFKPGGGVIAMNHSFHGRTFGALTATGQEKYKQGFQPLLPGFTHVDFNDFDGLARCLDEKTSAVLIEPIQGEGGIHPADQAFLEKTRALCDEKGVMLIFDEVQCGVGRTGKFFAFEHFGVEPDAVALAKGLAGGVPIGAILAKKPFADLFVPGDHASTFGGNPLATSAANVVVDELWENGLLEHVQKVGAYLTKRLSDLRGVKEVRGIGLMQGIELDTAAAPIVSACLEKGLLLVNAGANVIRFVPPLIVTEPEIDQAIGILETVI